MAKASSPTPKRREKAAIYLDAARRLSESDYGNFDNSSHCPDIAIGTTEINYRREPERVAFRQAFGSYLGSFTGHRHAAILALCFMAAMVEAGDA